MMVSHSAIGHVLLRESHMLVLTYATLATVDELFRYKSQGFKLDDFPGYTPDQWGIKAHNRPWIEEAGQFARDQKVIEVGGYSLLPKYLAEKYELEAWIGDDFGMAHGEPIWSRWGSPLELPSKYPSVKYVFEQFGSSSSKYPDGYFDRVFTVSTLEHIPYHHRLAVFKDMHRCCLKRGGRQLHTIDIPTMSTNLTLMGAVVDKIDKFSILKKVTGKSISEIRSWFELIRASGVKITIPIPVPMQLLDRRILVESPDVVYRFYPPNNAPKPYRPSASLCIIIENR